MLSPFIFVLAAPAAEKTPPARTASYPDSNTAAFPRRTAPAHRTAQCSAPDSLRAACVITVKYTLQHSQVRLIFWAKYRFITHQPVFARGWLLKACLVKRVDPGERERFRFLRVRKFQLINAAAELLTLCVQKFCQPCVAAGLQESVIFFIQQAEVCLQGHTIRLRLVPLFHAGIYLGNAHAPYTYRSRNVIVFGPFAASFRSASCQSSKPL